MIKHYDKKRSLRSRKMGKLKPYWVSVPSGGYCEPDPAVLVFARYATEARAVAHRETELSEFEYIELRSFCYARKFAKRFAGQAARWNGLSQKEAERLKEFKPVWLPKNFSRPLKGRVVFVNLKLSGW
jgi:hypothetical protein